VRGQQDVSSECSAFLSQDKIRATVREQIIENVASIVCNVHTIPFIEALQTTDISGDLPDAE
jgi:hypothetical protein